MARRALLFAALLAASLILPAGCGEKKPVFRVAYMICNSLEETRGRFDPVTAYLSEATGARFEAVYLDTADFEEAFDKGGIDFTHTNSLLYVMLEKRHKVRLLAAEKRGSFGALTKGTVIVRADSPVKTLEDLKGKRVIFGPQWAPFGFLAQYSLLLENGIDPEMDLGPYGFPPGSWKHEKIIYSVLYGAYDAGAAPLIDLEEMAAEGRIAPGDLRIIASTGLAPYCTFAASEKVPPDWEKKVRSALVDLKPSDTATVGVERVAVLKRALVDGFEALEDRDYDNLREWAKAAKMPPYEKP